MSFWQEMYGVQSPEERYPNIVSDPVGNIDAGTGFALNPKTGQREQLYAVAPLDPLEANHSDYRFASDGLTPQHVSLAGWSPGFHSDNSGTWSNFMERAVLGGLGAIGGVAIGSVAGGAMAGGEAAGAGAEAGAAGTATTGGTAATTGGGLTGATASDLASGALKGAVISGGKTAIQGGNLNDVLKSAGTGAISGGTGVMAGGGLLGAGVSAGTNQALSNNTSNGGDQVATTGTQDTGLNTLYNNPNNLTTGQQDMGDPFDFGSYDPSGTYGSGEDTSNPYGGWGSGEPEGQAGGATGTDDGLPDWLKQSQEMYKNMSPFLRQILGLPSSGDPNKPDPYRFPYGNIITAGLGVGGEMARQKSLQNTMSQVLNADQWNSEAPKYRQPLYDAATQGIGNTAYGRSLADASARKMSSMGYNMSGNQMNDVAQSLNAGTTQYIGALSPLAMGRAPDTRALAPLGLGMAESQGNLYNALNYGAQSVLRGDQSTGIGQPRQTLPQIFGF